MPHRFREDVSQKCQFRDERGRKLIAIQILDCWMRYTSIRWQVRAWNRYSVFTDFAEKRGFENVGHMLMPTGLVNSRRGVLEVFIFQIYGKSG